VQLNYSIREQKGKLKPEAKVPPGEIHGAQYRNSLEIAQLFAPAGLMSTAGLSSLAGRLAMAETELANYLRCHCSLSSPGLSCWIHYRFFDRDWQVSSMIFSSIKPFALFSGGAIF
jgi:hypothetical protein